ncbi:NifU family protein [Patescibacteria group bacterium]|nr:NifU family protein [Patescibacteria group bacterium]MBU1890269.1 NifU family protein [Patescibacteria group bacterium]
MKKVKSKESLEKSVKIELNKIRPAIQADGGDIEFVSMKSGVVKVRLKGACATCPLSEHTLKMFVEQRLKEEARGIKKVEQVT